MLNQDRFKTAEERIEAFEAFCESHDCESCEIGKKRLTNGRMVCAMNWLSLKAEEEKPEQCPSCSSTNILAALKNDCGQYYCECGGCGLRSSMCDTPEAAKDSYNRLARTIRAASEREVK